MLSNENYKKAEELLQRLIDAVGDCEDTGVVLQITKDAESLLHPRTCSFCERTQHEVETLVAANKDIAICGDCIDLAADSRFELEGKASPKSREIWVLHAVSHDQYDQVVSGQSHHKDAVKYREVIGDE